MSELEMRGLTKTLLDYVSRVTSKTHTMTRAESEVLPAIVRALLEIYNM